MSPILALSNLPERNPFFTGREQVLAELQEALTTRGRAALSGLGGVGKTQTAVEYAHRHLEEYDCNFLVSASSREGLLSGYLTIAALLKLPEADSQDQMLAVEAVKRWLGSQEGWLLILDNSDTTDNVKLFLPPSPRGDILLTSRADVFDTIEIVKPVDLNEMSPVDALTFLLKRTEREYEGSHESNAASELAAELGFLPLALEQAGAYIVRKKSLFHDYLKSFRKRRLELLSKHGPVAGGYRESVRTTWSMNFRQLEQESEAAADLLRLSAFLSSDSIPLEFLAAGAPELGIVLSAALADVQEDPVVLDETLAPLTNFSLIRRQIETRSYSVHRLVQAVIRAEMDPKTERLWAERAVRAINRAFPDVVFSSWALCERLLPQAHACAELIKQWGLEFSEAGRLLNQAGFYLKERGRYTDAKPLYERALAIREKAGSEHPAVAESLNNLAWLLKDTNRYAEAEPLFSRALSIDEKSFGPEDPAVARDLNNLGLLFRDTNRHAEAEPLFRRALATHEKSLERHHPDVVADLNNLAWLLKDLNRHAEAESLFRRALEGAETLGTEHPVVAGVLNNLGMFYHSQGRFEEAEPLFDQALAIREKVLGPEHPAVAASLNNLAWLLKDTNRHAQAEPLFWRALAIHEKGLGRHHPDVATDYNNLAWLLKDTDRRAEAEPLFRRALSIDENSFGPEHPAVARDLNNLGLLLRHTSRHAEAEVLFCRALAIREKAIGPEHPDVVASINNLAELYRAQGKHTKAEPLEARARAIRAKSA